jgi:protein SCO1
MSSTDPSASPAPKIAPWTIWIPIIIMAMGVVIFFNYANSQALKNKQNRAPYLGKLERDLDLVERSGQPVKLSQIKGKVMLASHFYSTCPMGCAVLADKMKDIRDEVAPKNPKLQLVSFAIDPGDTPARLKAVAQESYEVAPDDSSWWFVNGDQKMIRNYLTLQFKFYTLREKEPKERTSDVDKYAHDMRIALVDHQANLRGLYDVMSPDPELSKLNLERLKKHLAEVLAEAGQ